MWSVLRKKVEVKNLIIKNYFKINFLKYIINYNVYKCMQDIHFSVVFNKRKEIKIYNQLF